MGELNNERLLSTDNENTIFQIPACKGNLDISECRGVGPKESK
jgi:hypothetical protein